MGLGGSDAAPDLRIFRALVSAGANLNAVSKSGTSIMCKLLMFHEAEYANHAGTLRHVEIATRWLFESSGRAGEIRLDQQFRTVERGNYSVAEIAIEHPSTAVRRIVLRAAAEREDSHPGSGDPDNLLRLRDAPTTHRVPNQIGHYPGRHQPRSDPPTSLPGPKGHAHRTRH